MSKEFEELQEENNNLRMELALCIADLKPKIQTKIIKVVNEIINNEIEQEGYCGE